MTVHPVTPIQPDRLKRMRWRGQRAYRLLSYSFSLRTNRARIVGRVDDVFGAFALPRGAARYGEVYRIVDLGTPEPRRYRLLRGDQQLVGSRVLGDVVHQLTYHAMVRMMEESKEFVLIHAGAVVTQGGNGVLLPASTGSGKTTLVTGLVRAGFGFLSDEVGVIEPWTARLHPFPRALNLKDGTLALFPDLRPEDDGMLGGRRHGYREVGKIRQGSQAGPTQLGFVIAPRHREGARTEVIALSAAETAKELWANAMNLPLHGSQALPILADVAGRVKGYRLVSSNLQESVEAVMGLVGADGPRVPVLRN
jgi:hypothetical protein